MTPHTLSLALAGLSQGLVYSGKIEDDRRVSSKPVWCAHCADYVCVGMAWTAGLLDHLTQWVWSDRYR
jgi:hypothetical protein